MINVSMADEILKLITGTTTSSTLTSTGKCYLGFSSTTPNADGTNFTEPDKTTYPSYRRVQLNIREASQYTNLWGSVANGTVSNAKEITSAECKEAGGWPTFTHFGIFGQETGGEFLMADELTDPEGSPDSNGRYPAKSLTVAQNHVAILSIGKLQLKLS